MKVSEILRMLKDDGWFLDREGKKHSLYKHSSKSGIVIVPRHPATELKKGTQISILKQAGLK